MGWALITGASSGLGACFATALAQRGKPVILVARRRKELDVVARKCRAFNVQAKVVELDITRHDAVAKLKLATNSVFVDFLVNNAGRGMPGDFGEQPESELRSLIELNCTSHVLITNYFVRQMKQRRCGIIINVSSVVGIVPSPYEAVYGSTKAFNKQFGDSLALELRKYSITVLNLLPAFTRTGFLAAEKRSKDRIPLIQGDDPDKIVRIALADLGRRRNTGPLLVRLTALGNRFLPQFVIDFFAFRAMKAFTRR